MIPDTSIVAARTWVNGHSSEVDLADLAEAIRAPDSLTWVDLLSPERRELDALAREFGLGATAVEDALAPHERPKVTRHRSHLFFTVYATRVFEPERSRASRRDGTGHGRLRISRVSGFVLPKALITIRLDDEIDMAQVRARWDDNADLLPLGTGALVHGLLDVVVDSHFDTIQRLDDGVEALEDVLFEEGRTGHVFIRQVYGLRKDLVALRRAVLPMREVVSALVRHPATTGSGLAPWFDDLEDHVLRASEWTDSLRDLVASVFETNLSLQDARLNGIMKQLAGWAAIIAVPTAITGWFGQNVPYPGFGTGLGVVLTTALIVLCSATLYVAFRRRDWL